MRHELTDIVLTPSMVMVELNENIQPRKGNRIRCPPWILCDIMLEIALLDDDSIIRQHVEAIIHHTLFEMQVDYHITHYDTAKVLLSQLNILPINLLILDIEMPDSDGLSLSKQLAKNHEDLIIIFLTSYDQYVRDAFGLNVFQYILKPEADRLLPNALKTVLQRMESNRQQKILFKTKQGEVLINERDIICILYEQRSPCVLTKTEKIRLSSGLTMREIYVRFDPQHFVQPNSSAIINLAKITKITKSAVSLAGCAEDIALARGKYKDIYQKYTTYLLQGDTL